MLVTPCVTAYCSNIGFYCISCFNPFNNVTILIGSQILASQEAIKDRLQQVDGNLKDEDLTYKYVS